MKLKLITEVFDQLSLDGVTVNGETYSYKDPSLPNSPVYKVTIDYGTDSMIFANQLRKSLGSILCYSLYLTASNEGGWKSEFNLTKLNNSFFVYGKMLACFIDYCRKNGLPHFIEFYGMDDTMELAYDKLLKLVGRKYPELAFVPYSIDDDSGLYIRKAVLDSLPDDLRVEILKAIDFASENRVAKLNKIKKMKNLGRGTSPF